MSKKKSKKKHAARQLHDRPSIENIEEKIHRQNMLSVNFRSDRRAICPLTMSLYSDRSTLVYIYIYIYIYNIYICVCVYYSLFCRTYSTQYVFILLLNWLCTLSAPLPAEHFLCASLAPLQPRIQGMASDIIVEILHQEKWAKAFAGTPPQ